MIIKVQWQEDEVSGTFEVKDSTLFGCLAKIETEMGIDLMDVVPNTSDIISSLVETRSFVWNESKDELRLSVL